MSGRREFLKNLGVGSIGAFISVDPSVGEEHIPRERSRKATTLNNGVEIDVIYKDRLFFEGIGKVSAKGTLLRNAERPMFVDITNPDGIQLFDYRVVDSTISEREMRFRLRASVRHEGTMEWMLHTVRNRKNLADWTKPQEEAVDTEIEMIILPVSRKAGGFNLSGISYQYRYKSASVPIYKLLDRGSWEINGSALGNHFWMRNGVVDSIVQFDSKDKFYSTEWFLPGISNPNIFQFHPLQTQLQGFTFTGTESGALITWANRVSHIRSLFEKWRGSHEIIHFHEHCNDLALEFETAPIEVLWCDQVHTYVDHANLYEQVRELVHEQLHNQIGMRRERVTTYGIIEEWTEPDFDRYRERGVAKLVDVGVKKIFIPNQCQNTMNTWGVSNMCCNVDFKISESVGESKLKQFCDAAKQGGAKVEMWGNTAISTLTELFSHRDGRKKGVDFLPYEGSIMQVIDKAESPWIRNPSNAIEADHYAPRFLALNLRDQNIRSYWMKQWKHFHDNIGIDGIFLDSSFNMSSDKFHFQQWLGDRNWQGATLDQKDLLGKYRPEQEPAKVIHTMYHAHLDWVVEMQKMGYSYCGEDLGIFGINRTGPNVQTRVGNMFMWQDSYCDFDETALKDLGYEPFDVFFKGLAYRLMWKVYWDIEKDVVRIGTEDPRAFKLIRIFNDVESFMFNRVILDGETGVTYSQGNTRLLWAFGEVEYFLGKTCKVKNLISGETTRAKRIRTNRNCVYQITCF